jgi:hypothetical protein
MKKQSMKKIATKPIKAVSAKSNTIKLKPVATPKGKAPTKVKQTLGDRIKNTPEKFGKVFGGAMVAGATLGPIRAIVKGKKTEY